MNEEEKLTGSVGLQFQLFPHSEMALHRQDHSNKPFVFSPVEKVIYEGESVQIGRKIDRSKDPLRGTTREDRAQNNVSVDINHMSTTDKDDEEMPKACIAFRSKVVSRNHAEFFCQDGQLYFKDVGSSSGSFLNRLRLSPTAKSSKPFPLKSGDIIQLGVDYQGRHEEIYKAVMIQIFINSKKNVPALASKQKLNRALRSLLHAMNPNSRKEDEVATVECCICISPISPFQALFLAPCSHCFHYKCVTTLLGAGFMFQCPLCRQVANLEASVAEPDDISEMDVEEESSQDFPLPRESYVKEGESSHNARIDDEVMDEDEDFKSGSNASPLVSNSGNSVPGNIIGTINTIITEDRAPTVAGSVPQARRPDVPVQIFNTLTKLSEAVASGEQSLMHHSIDEYIEQMKTLLLGLGRDEAKAQYLMKKMIDTLGGSSQ